MHLLVIFSLIFFALPFVLLLVMLNRKYMCMFINKNLSSNTINKQTLNIKQGVEKG